MDFHNSVDLRLAHVVTEAGFQCMALLSRTMRLSSNSEKAIKRTHHFLYTQLDLVSNYKPINFAKFGVAHNLASCRSHFPSSRIFKTILEKDFVYDRISKVFGLCTRSPNLFVH